MTSEAELLPCPFCCQPMTISRGLNSHGRCDTKGCFINRISIGVATDEPAQVAAWNTRATHPVQGEAVACQACGGRIEGWTCQVCARVFLENDAGALVMGTAPPPVTCEPSRKAITAIVSPLVASIAASFSQAERDRYTRDRVDAILAALTPPAGGEG